MQNEINIKFCNTSNVVNGQNKSSVNMLCEKCNNYQELKLQDLNKFTSKSEVIFSFYKIKGLGKKKLKTFSFQTF